MKLLNGGRKAPTEAEVTQVESRFGVTLPKSYLDFLSNSNGRFPKKNIFDLPRHLCSKQRSSLYIQTICPLSSKVTPNVLQESEQYSLPAHSLVVGLHGNGYLLISCQTGMIMLEDCSRIADSLQSLVAGLSGEEQPEDTLIQQLAYSGDLAELRRYILSGGDINARTQGESIIEIAALCGDIEFVRACIESGATTQGLSEVMEDSAAFDQLELLQNEGLLKKSL